jgi:hypothetical protein
MKIVDRTIENVTLSLAKKYPVITITGAKQSGKTTHVKKLFPDKAYLLN